MSTAAVARPAGEERFRLEGRGRGRGRRGGWRALVGVVLVVVCVALFVVVGGRREGRREVLMVTRAVPPGQVLEVGDVRAVSVVVDPAVEVVPAGEAGQVVGRPAAVTLSAGTLLSAGSVGRRLLPPDARLVGASVKPGAFPLGLAAGDPVTVLLTSDATDSSDAAGGVAVVESGSSVDGVVVAVEPGPVGSGGLVVSVQVGSVDAERVGRAAAGGQVALVLRGPR
ncbi:SAF domain-containing protein [Frankia sp. AgPm24]|uniref:SAF domain-containing protein n=1 Tax=Frankia sp. AgPm24 TaxID=631128 RepID=UPI00200FFD2C|nr:SAF domain-containing protein [Frankia sp. AgPm24]MCK9922184.1 SAF domain-containing protein [Frankia sp. AgPm24]